MWMAIRIFTLIGAALVVGCSSENEQADLPPEHLFDRSLHDLTRGSAEQRYLLGIYDPKEHPRVKKVDDRFTTKPVYLREEVYDAFRDMHAAAADEGINLIIVSGIRTFDYQRYIWNRKWNRFYEQLGAGNPEKIAKKILEFSAMPATSRHHWGTDIDLNALENEWFEQGSGKRVYDWLSANAHRYGFCQVYSARSFNNLLRPGYNEEKWHWSYIPSSASLLDRYMGEIGHDDITGFKGSDLAERLKIKNDFVAGINSRCTAPAFEQLARAD